MRKLVLFFLCIGLASFAFPQVPVSPSNKPPPHLLPPPPKPKHEYLLSNSSEKLEWKGTVEEAEKAFIKSAENSVDVVRDRESKKSITGTLTIVGTNGNLQGKVELEDGKLHGKEIFYDNAGKILKTNYWIAGKPSKIPPPPRPIFNTFAERSKAENKGMSNPTFSIKPKIMPPSPHGATKLRSQLSEALEFSGNFKEIIHYEGGKKHGPYKSWYENEQISNAGMYKDGNHDGLWTSWWANGQKESVINWKDGKKDKLWTSWYKNGQKESERNFKGGKQEGLQTWWYESGQKLMEQNWMDGKLDGLETLWYESGQKLMEQNWMDGKPDGLETLWYESGQKESERNFKDGKHFGAYKKWDENGTLIRTGRYIDRGIPQPRRR